MEWRQRWNTRLSQFLRRRVRAAVDVQDLTQETYLRLLRGRDLSEVRNPEAYLLRVAKHVVLEWCDDLPRTNSVVEFDDEMLVDEHLPELELDARLSERRLEETLATVSPMMRAVLVLRLRDQLSHEAIGAELKITPRQVRRYLARGYERMRVAVEG